MSTLQDETGQSPCPVCGIREWGIIAPGVAECVCGHKFADPDEEVPADLELARLRLRQATERIRERFPSAARDGQLASILSGLSDALGQGGEPAEPEALDLAVYVGGVTPDLAVAVDGSQCIVLLVSEPHGKLLRRVTVPDVGHLKTMLDTARDAALAAVHTAEKQRLGGRDERRRAEGRFTRSEAVADLTRRSGRAHVHVLSVVRRAQAVAQQEGPVDFHGAGEAEGKVFLVGYGDDGYWTIHPAGETADV